MHVWTTHSRVPQSYPVRRSGGDGSHQSSQHSWLANPNECDRGPVIVGFVNFYQWFIQDFLTCSQAPTPAHQERRGLEMDWDWTGAFEELKWLIMLTPILVQPDQDMQFWIETDASRYATGAVLSQLCKDDKCHPVGFKSESLSDTERNYKIHDKELLSVIWGLEEWRHILEGTSWWPQEPHYTSGHPKIWIPGKQAGPYFWLGSSSPSSIGQGDTQPNWMPSHNGQIIWPRKRTTLIKWCYWLINSTDHLSRVNHWWLMVTTLLMLH